MRQAEVYGYRPEDSNPCIQRYRRQGRERFLTVPEGRHLVFLPDNTVSSAITATVDSSIWTLDNPLHRHTLSKECRCLVKKSKLNSCYICTVVGKLSRFRRNFPQPA